MTIEEGILSDDVEIVKLYLKIYLKNNTKEDLSKLLENNNFFYDFFIIPNNDILYGIKKNNTKRFHFDLIQIQL